jgi:hypothetical protein
MAQTASTGMAPVPIVGGNSRYSISHIAASLRTERGEQRWRSTYRFDHQEYLGAILDAANDRRGQSLITQF